MTYANNPAPNMDNVIDVEAVEVLDLHSERSIWELIVGRSSDTVLEDAQRVMLIEKCRASLTYSAIQHATAYSVMEGQLATTSPRGAARIGALIDAYTTQAIKTIKGW